MYKKILVIRFSSIGDIILTTPVVRALKEKFKDASVDILLKKEFSDIYADSPYVDNVIRFDSKKHNSITKLLSFSKKLKKNDYDLVIDLHRNLRSFIIRRNLNANKVLCYNKDILKRRLLVAFKIRFDNMPHVVDRYLEPLKEIGIENADRTPTISLSEKDVEFSDRFFEENGVQPDTKTIALFPGAKNRAKMYPIEKFANLIGMITSRLKANVIIIGGNSDEKIISDLTGRISDMNLVSTFLSNSLKQSGSIVKKCDAVITNDSGPMHLSVAVGTRVIALFGPTDERFGFYPLGKDDVVLTKGYKCSPCSLHGKKDCIKYDYKCLNDISEEEIVTNLALN
ncbi:glycosyltransferase family 9 protein [Thermodesulfobacteriota bacterium]